MISKTTFRQALLTATEELANEQQRDIIFAAPLALRVLERLKRAIGEEKARELAGNLGERQLKLTGSLFGESLCPTVPPEERPALKFRQFLEAFPDIVQVFKGPSGDMVRLLKRQVQDTGDLNRRYRQLLLDTLLRLLKEGDAEEIPANKLAIWMKKRMPAFNVSHLGYSSLTEWLANVPEVAVQTVGGVVRVGLREQAPLTVHENGPPPDGPQIGYFLVDSSDLHSVMHGILGAKPTQAQLPDWAGVIQYFRDRWPHLDWRGRYFMALTPAEHQSLQGLFNYLDGVGLKVVKINLRDEGLSFEELRKARLQTTMGGIVKALDIIRNAGQPGAVIVASHSAGVSEALAKFVKGADTAHQIGVAGFAEKMPTAVLDLKGEGLLLLDLERDCHAFKKPLRRSLGYNLDDISAQEIL